MAYLHLECWVFQGDPSWLFVCLVKRILVGQKEQATNRRRALKQSRPISAVVAIPEISTRFGLIVTNNPRAGDSVWS